MRYERLKMNHDLIRKITYQAMKLLFAFLIFLFIITVFHVESNKKSPEEIAKMLSGKTVTETSINNAMELLSQ